MKKKLLTLMLAAMMALSLAACQSAGNSTSSATTEVTTEVSKSSILGTWSLQSVVVKGSTYSLAEIEATGDYSMSNLYMVFKEGTSVYVSEDGEGDTGEYSFDPASGSLTIGNKTATYDSTTNTFTINVNNNSLIFGKLSDSQDITKIPANKEATTAAAQSKN